MQANRRGLLKQKKQEKTRNKLRRKPSSALLVADRNRVRGFGQRLSMKGRPRPDVIYRAQADKYEKPSDHLTNTEK